jgi:hypothetical protein
MYKVSKKEVMVIINQYKNRFIDFKEQKESTPNYVYNDYIRWLYQSWEDGLINISQYRKAITINILEV